MPTIDSRNASAAGYQQMLGRLHSLEAGAPPPGGSTLGTDTYVPSATAPTSAGTSNVTTSNGTLAHVVSAVEGGIHNLLEDLKKLVPSASKPEPVAAPVQAPAPPTPPPAPTPAPKAAPDPRPAPPPAPKAGGTYQVRPGDSLSLIAERTLGNGNRWREIFDLNRDQLSNPDLIQPGQVLKLPGGASAPSAPAPAPAAHAVPGGSVGQWIDQAMQIMESMGVPRSKMDPGGIATIIQHESGGNPNAVNNWDSNAAAGHPSKGLMQTIGPTFDAYAAPGHRDIFNPVDNIIAGVRYAISRYGSIQNVPGIRNLAHGGSYVGY